MTPLPAGPDLDAAIAELMGWKSHKSALQPKGSTTETAWLLPNGKYVYKRACCFSSDLSTIAGACEEMREKGRIDGWVIESPYAHRPLTALVYVDSRPEPDDIVGMHGESLAHALSLALKAALEASK